MASHLPHSASPQFLIPNSKISATRNLQIPRGDGNAGFCRKKCILSSKCAEGGSVGEIEKKLEEQIGREEDLARIGKPTGKPEEVGEMVELLENLEREAIMGEDEGKEPMDYNRRAHIFDKSSTVFQALKKTSETAAATTNTNDLGLAEE
ncbi:hypothetical protein HAX54_001863 [Datura stramonium]|uniref:Uncharacterized protein n=1 Tax=Datura stramonium TaxID=4076 RepID=A0ABS8T319_DATST|nr:hypothetical protein [Datura stramonium]